MAGKEKKNIELADAIEQKVSVVNEKLEEVLSGALEISDDLAKPIRYTLIAPGKRLRAALVLWCCELIAGEINPNALSAAAAVEMVHTYSLIHDDTPAMDNDDYRRGRLSCHKKFDEATAILTGDALLTAAFELLAKEVTPADTAVKIIAELSKTAGPAGMVAGQMADLKAEKLEGTRQLLEYIHNNKTAKMFASSAIIGGICGGAGKEELEKLSTYGLKIGLGFQISDDILDESATAEQLGKTAGKDKQQGKVTYPAIVGMKKSKQIAEEIANQAIKAIEPFGERAKILVKLATALFERTS